ncbi:MAG: endo-1,4-beta-xylanase [Planctomycetaceae bacterium]|jgi:GH35 family endo-1,4-beta-xylanase|nr:endo-1,4-beta-xylanase [Planctomycetaceae bacterium]
MKESEMVMLTYLWTNPSFVQRLDANINKNRSDEFIFRLVDRNNNPVANADIHVSMTAHDFRFGIRAVHPNIFNSPETVQRYGDWARTTLNQMTVHTCWRWLEPTQNNFCLNNLNQSIADADNYGLKKLAHCLFWDHWDWFKPTWVLPEINHDEYMRLWRRYIDVLADKYNDKIDAWHVINEATFKEDGKLSDRVIVQNGFYKAFDYTRQKLKGEQGACFYQDAFYTACKQGMQAPAYVITKDLIKRGIPVDFISFQFHVFDNRWLQQEYHPGNIRRTIEKFGAFGVPIEIAEFGVYFGIDLHHPDLRDSNHDPAVQAALIKSMYKFFFSLSEMRAVTYWHEFGRNAWNVNMITDENWNLLPSGQEITNLINNTWKTNVSGKTDCEGIFASRCFFGDYRIDVQTKDGLFTYNVPLRKQSDRNIVFTLP